MTTSRTADTSTGAGTASPLDARAAAGARVVIVVGSHRDLPAMEPATALLTSLAIPHELRVLSAHRTPEQAAELARTARARGVGVLIAAAGAAAHLAGALAAQTTLPVIGVPISATPLNGFESLLSTVQMPGGVPVATVAVNGAQNSALLAAQILGVADAALAERLQRHKEEMSRAVVEHDSATRGLRGADSGRVP